MIIAGQRFPQRFFFSKNLFCCCLSKYDTVFPFKHLTTFAFCYFKIKQGKKSGINKAGVIDINLFIAIVQWYLLCPVNASVVLYFRKFFLQGWSHRKHRQGNFLRGNHPIKLLYLIEPVNVFYMKIVKAFLISNKKKYQDTYGHTDCKSSNVKKRI